MLDGTRGFAVATLLTLVAGCGDSAHKPPSFTSTGATGSTSGGGGSGGSGSSTGSTGSGSSSTTGSGGSGPVGTLTKVVSAAPWIVGQDTTGIAVDPSGTVFVQDHDTVYSVTGTTVATDLTLSELDTISGETHFQFYDLDRDPDGAIYVLAPESTSDAGTLLKRTGPHSGTVFAELSGLGDMTHLGVVTADRMALIRFLGGLWSLEGGVLKEVHTAAVMGNGTGCTTEHLAVQASGIFLYQVGCNTSPIVRGSVLGGTPDTFQPNQFAGGSNFICSARDPKGGFYVMMESGDTEALNLMHVDENFAPPQGMYVVSTTPTVAAAGQAEGNLTFRFCSMATADDGTLFIQTFDQLWKVEF